MTTYNAGNIDQWVLKTRKGMEIVAKQATNDMLKDIKVVPGITRGGSRVRGTIPRDLGVLANSLQSELYGTTAMTQTGEASYTFVIGQMSIGDVASFSWGGPLAGSYVRWVHDGTDSVQGTHWTEVAGDKWPGYVKGALAKLKSRIFG